MTDETAKKRRNKRALKFFTDAQLDVRIIGNINTPAFLINDNYVLNCYCQNFYLVFMDSTAGGNELFRIKLTDHPKPYAQDIFTDFLHNYKHKPIYKVALQKYPNLFLSGYSLTDLEDKDNCERVPVFGTVRPTVYFQYETAFTRTQEFATRDYNLIVIENK